MDYFVTFVAVPKEIRKTRKLRLKHPYTLNEADTLLKELQSIFEELPSEKANVSITLHSYDQTKQYDFEEVSMVGSFGLESTLTADIYNSLKEVDAKQAKELETLADELYRQMEEEERNPQVFKQQLDTQKKEKKFSFSKVQGLLKKSIKQPSIKQNEGKEHQLITEVPLKPQKEVEPPKVPAPVYDTPTLTGFDYGETEQIKQSKPKEPTIKQTSFAEGKAEQQLPSQQVHSFQIQDYLSVQSLTALETYQKKIQELTHSEQTEEEWVFQKLGLVSDTPTRLDQKKMDYLRNIYQVNFSKTLQAKSEHELTKVKREAIKQLESKWVQSEYDGKVFDSHIEQLLGAIKEELITTSESKRQELLQELEKKEEQAQQSIVLRHQNELDQLQAKQQEELTTLIQKLSTDRTERLQEFKETAKSENRKALQQEKSQLIEKVREEKEHQLIVEKGKIESSLNQEVAELVIQTEKEEEEYFNHLRNQLNQQTDQLKTEVYQEERIEQKAKERQLLEEQNKLKEQELLLVEQMKKDAEKESRKHQEAYQQFLEQQIQAMENNNKIYQDIEKFKQDIEKKEQASLNDECTLKETEEKEINPIFSKINDISIKKGGIGLVIFFTLLGGTGVYSAHQNNQKLKKDMESMQIEVGREKKKSKAVQQEIQNNVLSNEQLDYYLAKQQYFVAVSLYPTQKDKIETAIFNHKDVENLKAFNELYRTICGKLDLAILAEDTSAIIKEYETLTPENKLKHLSNERKKAIQLAYFEKGEIEKAKSLKKIDGKG